MQITKKNGVIVVFDDDKVRNSILKANLTVSGEVISEKAAETLTGEVFSEVTSRCEVITTADVRKAVISVLKSHGYGRTAENYETYSGKKK